MHGSYVPGPQAWKTQEYHSQINSPHFKAITKVRLSDQGIIE